MGSQLVMDNDVRRRRGVRGDVKPGDLVYFYYKAGPIEMYNRRAPVEARLEVRHNGRTIKNVNWRRTDASRARGRSHYSRKRGNAISMYEAADFSYRIPRNRRSAGRYSATVYLRDIDGNKTVTYNYRFNVREERRAQPVRLMNSFIARNDDIRRIRRGNTRVNPGDQLYFYYKVGPLERENRAPFKTRMVIRHNGRTVKTTGWMNGSAAYARGRREQVRTRGDIINSYESARYSYRVPRNRRAGGSYDVMIYFTDETSRRMVSARYTFHVGKGAYDSGRYGGTRYYKRGTSYNSGGTSYNRGGTRYYKRPSGATRYYKRGATPYGGTRYYKR